MPKQKKPIQGTWAQVVPIADQAAAIFYQRLFEIDPSTRPLFRSTDMAQQRKKLLQVLGWRCRRSTISARSKTVEDLGRRHAGYGVKDAITIRSVSRCSGRLEQGLGNAWTPKPRRLGRKFTGFCPASCARPSRRRAAKAA